MPELLQTTLEIPYKGEAFVFKIPSILDELKVGGRERALRIASDPSWNGFNGGLDWDTAAALRAAATFEVLLERGPEWAFTPGKDGKPIVDIAQVSSDHNADVYAIYDMYRSALDSFRVGRAAAKNTAGGEAVAG